MKRILITGGAGQVGTDLIHLFHEQGAEVSVFDVAPPPENLPEGVDWRRGDITDASELDEFVKSSRHEVIFHLAALLSAIGEKMPHRCYRVNMDGTLLCWGDDTFGQSTPPPGTFIRVSASNSHTCGVRTDNTVSCWGYQSR